MAVQAGLISHAAGGLALAGGAMLTSHMMSLVAYGCVSCASTCWRRVRRGHRRCCCCQWRGRQVCLLRRCAAAVACVMHKVGEVGLRRRRWPSSWSWSVPHEMSRPETLIYMPSQVSRGGGELTARPQSAAAAMALAEIKAVAVRPPLTAYLVRITVRVRPASPNLALPLEQVSLPLT